LAAHGLNDNDKEELPMGRVRNLAVLLSTCAVLVTGVALADDGIITDQTPATCDSRSAATHIKQAKRTINAGWSRKRWRHGPKKAQGRAVKSHLRCLKRAKDRNRIKSYLRGKAAHLRLYRIYRRVAPYRGFRGEGIWLTWLAVPRYIVACETNGYHGEGRWRARNGSSSASGPYQMLDTWNRPMPADTPEKKVQHHISASRLGLSNWACA